MCKKLIFLCVILACCISPVAYGANIVLVTEDVDRNGDGQQDDYELVDWLVALGHDVDVQRGYWTTLDAGKIAALTAADLIIVSRTANSGGYNTGEEPTQWNAVPTPLLQMSAYLARNNRWLWVDSGSATNNSGAPLLQAVVLDHPVFRGVTLDASNQVRAVDGAKGSPNTSFIGTTDMGNGTLIAKAATGDLGWIAEWEPGVEFYSGASQTAGERRMLFCGGTQESPVQGEWNFTPEGETMFLNAINYLLGIGVQATATAPDPEDAAVDVPLDAVLGWTPGLFAASHNVYLGTSFDEVSAADTDNPLNVLVSPGQDANAYDPDGLLEIGQTYYWRVDEVNAPPDSTVHKGDVWSFTTEPYSYPIASVTATASSSSAGMGPEKTVDGSGLNDVDEHSTKPEDMWISAQDGPQPTWIEYAFDKIYELHEMWVWNSNQALETTFGFGAKDTTIEYSSDGETWTPLGDFEFAQATGDDTYAANTVIDFAGAAAQYVRLTISSNWASLVPQYSLSEVRFLYVPVKPREPQPADGATGVALDALLTWRAGREAVQHKVWFGEDRQAVEDGTAPAVTIAENSHDPGRLELGRTYYWKVAEIDDAEPPNVWEGDLWSFTAAEYLMVDDFEGYTDNIDAGETIWQTWLDGLTNGTGSIVGYFEAPFAEQTIVHDGRQSMPVDYNNVNPPYYSEVERGWDSAQDWTIDGADTLSLYVRGNPVGFAETTPETITMSAGGEDIWGTADQFTYAFKSLSGDGSIMVRVDSLENSDPWAKAGVMIRNGLGADVKNAMAYVTADGRVGWQYRELPIGTSVSTRSEPAAVTPPHWVRLTRTGNLIEAEHSSDGTTWEPMIEEANPTEPSSLEIPMDATVLIGLAVTSHNVDVLTTAEFFGASTEAPGPWQVAQIGTDLAFNHLADLYVAIQDTNNRLAVVKHPDPDVVVRSTWEQWRIALSDFTNVNLGAIKTLYIGVGDRDNPVPDGSGIIFIDDIGVGHPAAAE
mgnify:CR=1 FL=1